MLHQTLEQWATWKIRMIFISILESSQMHLSYARNALPINHSSGSEMGPKMSPLFLFLCEFNDYYNSFQMGQVKKKKKNESC